MSGSEDTGLPRRLAERVRALEAMDFLASHLNDEELVEEWLIAGVPDGTDGPGYQELADDDESFEWCIDAFISIMGSKQASDGGFCFD